MEQNIDLTTITDLDKLKSLAYDEIAKKAQSEQNLIVINQRIEQMVKAQEIKKKAEEAQNG